MLEGLHQTEIRGYTVPIVCFLFFFPLRSVSHGQLSKQETGSPPWILMLAGCLCRNPSFSSMLLSWVLVEVCSMCSGIRGSFFFIRTNERQSLQCIFLLQWTMKKKKMLFSFDSPSHGKSLGTTSTLSVTTEWIPCFIVKKSSYVFKNFKDIKDIFNDIINIIVINKSFPC